MKEASKAAKRRALDPRFAQWIKGDILDVGCGNDIITKEQYPSAGTITGYDRILGHEDAMTLPEFQGQRFDCIHSSHCLEHLEEPLTALARWLELLKPGGHIVCTIPDEDAYEKGVFPSRFNPDHKATFTIHKSKSWSPVSVNVLDMVAWVCGRSGAKPRLVQLLDHGVDYEARNTDQTASPDGPECAIEFVIQR